MKTAVKKPQDESLQVSIDVVEKDEKVTLCFDKSVAWIGIDPVQAITLAEKIKTMAVSILRSIPKMSHEKPSSG